MAHDEHDYDEADRLRQYHQECDAGQVSEADAVSTSRPRNSRPITREQVRTFRRLAAQARKIRK